MAKLVKWMKSCKFAIINTIKACKYLLLYHFGFEIIITTLAYLDLYSLNLLLSKLELHTKFHECVHLILIMILLQALTIIIPVLNMRISKKMEFNSKCYIDDWYYKKIIKLPLSVTDSVEGRNQIERVSNRKGDVYGLYETIIELIISLYSLSIAIITFVNYNALYALIFFIITLPGTISKYYNTMMYDKFEKKNLANRRYHSYYRWILTAQQTAKDVRMYTLTDDIKKQYYKKRKKYLKEKRKLFSLTLKIDTFFKLLEQVGLCFFIITLINDKLNNVINIGELVMFVGIAVAYIDALRSSANNFDNIIYFSNSVADMLDFENISCFEEHSGNKKITDFRSLEFKNVSFKYPGNDEYILKDLSFRINKGEKIVIIGINGSGKTTIVKIMLGLYQLNSGSILINDENINNYCIDDVRKLFSVLFQDFLSYPLTIKENVVLSNIENINDDYHIEFALKQSGSNDFLQGVSLDRHITREFDDEGIELSKGQKQKLALARTYFKKSPILIFDEPSAALDVEAENHVFNSFETLPGNTTGIMITHRIVNLKDSRILVLNNGYIAESGTHQQLLDKNGIYAHMYLLQKKKYKLEGKTQ